MKRTPVSSSNIRSIGYDLKTQVLEIEFIKGGIYQYKGVPQAVATTFMSMPSNGSHGEHFKLYIQDEYATAKVN